MNAEFDELVRDSMNQFTNEVTLPAGLADRARRQVRQRRRARVGGLTAVVTASVATALVVTAAGHARPAGPSTGLTTRAQLTAQVIRDVVTALTRTAATNPVEYARSSVGSPYYIESMHSGLHLKYKFRIGSGITWYRGGVIHGKSYSPGGRLLLESRQVTGTRTTTSTLIIYPDRAWSRGTYRNDGPPLTAPVTSCVLDVEYWTPAQWASQLKKLLSCGNVQAQGRQWVNGVDAIRLQVHTKKVRTCGVVFISAGGKRQRRCVWGIAGYPGTLFINPSTYLPIRYVDHGHDGERIDFGFLPPTRANLAKLDIVIPPGFKRA